MKHLSSILCTLFLLSACAGSMERRLDDVRTAYRDGDYVAAAQQFAPRSDVSKLDNLELLITADALFHANDFGASDAAYEEFNHRNLNLTDGDLGREAGVLLGGNMANSYRPFMMDALFVSYYQIWDALVMDRTADARVIINQSYDRQQNMSREYERLVQETSEAAAENPDAANRVAVENSQWHAFRDIMNPALTYLSGIYFLNSGHFGDAKTYLKRANGMMPGNEFIKADLNSAAAGQAPSGVAWIFIESGFAPKLREKRMDMPMPVGNSFTMVSLAVSEPVFAESGPHVDGAQLLTDVDALFMTEYGEYRINETIRALTSAVSKVALQSGLYNSSSPYAGLMGLAATAYSMASTSAEVRTWATLPKYIYLLRVKKDKSGLIELKSGGNVIATVNASQSGNDLIYLRLGAGAYDAKVIKIK